jgi:5-(carboxyamino)imidazole ribonucleotide synthase
MKLGVLGGGQLARMLALAAYPLGIDILCYESVPDTCANQVAKVTQGDYGDEAALKVFAQSVTCVTLETENLPLATAQAVAKYGKLLPNVTTLQFTQDRLLEKELLQSLDIPTAKFYQVNSHQDLQAAVAKFNLPGILKTRRSGYDGKGQVMLRKTEDIDQALTELQGQDLIYESFVPFDYEVSLICVRSQQGDILFYPLTRNEHREGILRVSQAPFADQNLQQQAEQYAVRLLERFSYVGIMAIEFFVLGGQLIANEIAPRVHNSGHWTIEGAVTSQFENHVRALAGLGSTQARGYSAMVNFIGTQPDEEKVMAIAGAHYHTYGKSARPGRKLGHVTLNAASEALLLENLEQVLKIS